MSDEITHQIDEVLACWFDGDSKKWWVKDEAFDAKIRERFGPLMATLREGVDDWLSTPRSCLAAIIVLDQFSRNAFRGTPDMVSADELARGICKHAIAKGYDLTFTGPERMFIYMPLEHSEHRDDQVMSVACFERFHDDEQSEMSESIVDYAHKHRAIVDRFGRYPHRNENLGRTSTPEEIEFLKGPNSSF